MMSPNSLFWKSEPDLPVQTEQGSGLILNVVNIWKNRYKNDIENLNKNENIEYKYSFIQILSTYKWKYIIYILF